MCTASCARSSFAHPADTSGPAVYPAPSTTATDNRLYLRFKPNSLYHIAFSVDSMYVGNGYVLKRNDIEVVNDPSASL